MIGLEDRRMIARDIEFAYHGGARRKPACAIVGVSVRTLQCCEATPDEKIRCYGRPDALPPIPAHALSEAERAKLLAMANEQRFADMLPARIVPILADEGIYLAIKSIFSRVLKSHGQMTHRGRPKAPKVTRTPLTHIASGPRQVWCCGMIYLPAQLMVRWFFLYMILDIYSRTIVGWEIHDTDHAAHLAHRTALVE